MPYPQVFLQVVDRDWDVFAALFQLNVWESWKGEVQTQILHWAAVHVQALQCLLQGLPRLPQPNKHSDQRDREGGLLRMGEGNTNITGTRRW